MTSQEDRKTLRDLARRVVEIARLPIMGQLRELWKRHNRLERVRPMVLSFPGGRSWQEELVPESVMECETEDSRKIEFNLRSRIYQYEHLHDDRVVGDEWLVQKKVTHTDWGLEPKDIRTDERGSRVWDPVIEDESDLERLRFPKVRYGSEEQEKTLCELETMQDLFGDILDVQLKGVRFIRYSLMQRYLQWRGANQTFYDFVDNPDLVHRVMTFLVEGYSRVVQQYVDLNLLTLNNDQTYHGSGGVGHSTELPQAGYDPERVRPCDIWAAAESQEMAHVSPRMHWEFVMQYEKRLLEPFGLNGYGCCDPLTNKLDYVFNIPNVRRISISPWAEVESCAEKLGDQYIFSWKPSPFHLIGTFDPEMVRDYIKHALDVTKGCVIELVLATENADGHADRYTRWADIVQDLAADY